MCQFYQNLQKSSVNNMLLVRIGVRSQFYIIPHKYNKILFKIWVCAREISNIHILSTANIFCISAVNNVCLHILLMRALNVQVLSTIRYYLKSEHTFWYFNFKIRNFDRMLADFYTKLLQGSLFRKMRDIVMGLKPFPEEDYIIKNCQIGEMLTKNMGNKQMKK